MGEFVVHAGDSLALTGSAPSGDPVVRFATNQLTDYLRQMARIEMVWSGPWMSGQGTGPHGIEVLALGKQRRPTQGYSATHRPLFERAQAEARSAETMSKDSFVIAVDEETVVLASCSGRGLLYAVYTLLEDLGACFIAPKFPFYEGAAEFIPLLSRVVLRPGLSVYAPSFELRKLRVEEGWSHTTDYLVAIIDWMGKNRFNVLCVPTDYQGLGVTCWDDFREELMTHLECRGIMLESGGHGYQSFLPYSRYGTSHPRWFSGTEPRDVFRVTERGALELYVRNVAEYLEQRPEIRIFEAWPPDYARWPEPDLKILGSPENIQATVANALLKELRARRLAVAVDVLAYYNAKRPPSVPLDSSVWVEYAPFHRDFSVSIGAPGNRDVARVLEEWRSSSPERRVCIYSYYVKYAWHSLPILVHPVMADDLAWYRGLGISGVGHFSEPGNWITYELTHWLLGRLMWCVSDGARYVERYCRARFGSAADEARLIVDGIAEASRWLVASASGVVGSGLPQEATEPLSREVRVAAIGKALEAYRAVYRLATGLRSWKEAPDGRVVAERYERALEFAMMDLELFLSELQEPQVGHRELRGRLACFIRRHSSAGVLLEDYYLLKRIHPGLRYDECYRSIRPSRRDRT